MNDQEKWLELADLYSVGALEGRELAEFEARLKSGCQVCAGRLKENQEALKNALPKNLAAPDAALKARVMEAIGEDELVLSGAPGVMPVWLAAFFWGILSVGIIAGWNFTGAKRHAMEFKRLESVMMASDTEVKSAELKPMDQPGPVSAKMMWNSKGECLFLTMGLPKITKEKAYELWGIAGGKPVAVGTFTVDEHGCGVFAAKNLNGKFEKFAVTLEPAGGLPAPSGPMVLAGAV